MRKILLVSFIISMVLACKSPEARKPISVKSGTFLDESIARNKALHEKEKAQFELYMNEHPETEFITSNNGFWYFYNSDISLDSITPQFGDIVNFNYEIKTIKGDIIYSSNELQSRDYAMDQEKLFSGLREGLKLMKAGETITFLFPSNKAFGYYGDKNKIGINVPIICEVTVNSITKTTN